MAKLYGAAKAAFLRMMAGGRKKKRRKGKGAKARARSRKRRAAPRKRGKGSRARRQNPIGVEALLVNPTGGSKMARKKSRKARKNPHGKRKRSRGRRRHNPMGGSMIQGIKGTVLRVGLPAVAAGAAAGFIESKFLGSKSAFVRGLVRLGLGVGSAVAFKGNPIRAAAMAGAIIGGIGNEQGIKMGGGLVLTSRTAGMKELAEAMSADDEMGAVFREEMQGLGTVVEMQQIADDGGEVGDADVDGLSEDDAA